MQQKKFHILKRFKRFYFNHKTANKKYETWKSVYNEIFYTCLCLNTQWQISIKTNDKRKAPSNHLTFYNMSDILMQAQTRQRHRQTERESISDNEWQNLSHFEVKNFWQMANENPSINQQNATWSYLVPNSQLFCLLAQWSIKLTN